MNTTPTERAKPFSQEGHRSSSSKNHGRWAASTTARAWASVTGADSLCFPSPPGAARFRGCVLLFGVRGGFAFCTTGPCACRCGHALLGCSCAARGLSPEALRRSVRSKH